MRIGTKPRTSPLRLSVANTYGIKLVYKQPDGNGAYMIAICLPTSIETVRGRSQDNMRHSDALLRNSVQLTSRPPLVYLVTAD